MQEVVTVPVDMVKNRQFLSNTFSSITISYSGGYSMTNDRRGEKAALVVLFKKRKGKKFFFLLFTFISQSNLAS